MVTPVPNCTSFLKTLKSGGRSCCVDLNCSPSLRCFGLSSALFADQVTLKNGDRLTGTVVKSDGKTLVLHTEAAGDVTIQFAAIQEIKTDQELHVSLKGGKTAVGPVTTTDGKIEIATKTAGTVEAPKDDVTLDPQRRRATGLRQVAASRTEARLELAEPMWASRSPVETARRKTSPWPSTRSIPRSTTRSRST